MFTHITMCITSICTNFRMWFTFNHIDEGDCKYPKRPFRLRILHNSGTLSNERSTRHTTSAYHAIIEGIMTTCEMLKVDMIDCLLVGAGSLKNDTWNPRRQYVSKNLHVQFCDSNKVCIRKALLRNYKGK